MACPYCQHAGEPRPLRFTWWGGVLGAKLLHHAECQSCARRYNARTGLPNTIGIAIYSIAVAGLGLAVIYWWLTPGR